MYPQFLICLIPRQISVLKQMFCYLEDLFLAFLYRHGNSSVIMFWIEALKGFHCTESSWRNNSRDFCLVPTGKLHHAVAGGERETPVLVRLKLLDGGCGNNMLGGHMWRCLGLARAGRWRDLELSQWTRITVGCGLVTFSRELPDVTMWLWSRSYRMWRCDFGHVVTGCGDVNLLT